MLPLPIKWSKTGGAYFADEDRAQRHTLALKDVAYLIKADIVLREHATEPDAKYRDQFRRRVSRGKCYHRPYLGCREFNAYFTEPDGTEKPVPYTDDLGLMLFDIDYFPDGTGRGTPRFYNAEIENGILKIPQELYVKEVV